MKTGISTLYATKHLDVICFPFPFLFLLSFFPLSCHTHITHFDGTTIGNMKLTPLIFSRQTSAIDTIASAIGRYGRKCATDPNFL